MSEQSNQDTGRQTTKHMEGAEIHLYSKSSAAGLGESVPESWAPLSCWTQSQIALGFVFCF